MEAVAGEKRAEEDCGWKLILPTGLSVSLILYQGPQFLGMYFLAALDEFMQPSKDGKSS